MDIEGKLITLEGLTTKNLNSDILSGYDEWLKIKVKADLESKK